MKNTHCKRGLQNRYPHRNHFLTALFIAVMVMFSTVPAFAAEATASTTAPDLVEGAAVEGDAFSDDETDVSEVTPAPTVVRVSTIEELLDAIAHANANDVIEIDGAIRTGYELILGRADCPVTIRRATPESYLVLGLPDMGNIKVQNITFDGKGVQAIYPFISINSPMSVFEKCNFVNCVSEDIPTLEIVANGDIIISDSHFSNNKGNKGAHLLAQCNEAIIENCTFTGGFANDTGSIFLNNTGKTYLTGCTISGNTAEVRGGGICVENGELIIERCKIYGNTSKGKADDITVNYWSHLSLVDNHDDLVSLYKSDGVVPNLWTVDSYFDYSHGSDAEHTDMIFSMTFVDGNFPSPNHKPDPKPEIFTVTFDLGDGSEPISLKTGVDGKLSVLPVPDEREGYIFDGWFMEDDTPITVDTVFTKNEEIHARWTEETPDPELPSKPETLPTSIALDKLNLTLDVGETSILTATLQPEGISGSIQWTSSAPSIASVDENGLVSALSAGTASITATTADGRVSASCSVKVQDVPTPAKTYTISVSVSPAEGGIVRGNGQYKEGDRATVTAIPNEGFRFAAWIEANEQISGELNLTFSVNNDRKLTAVFEPISEPAPKPAYAINVIATVGGTVSGEGKYEHGSSVTLTATPQNGYLFIGWIENGEPISTDANFTFTADRDRTIVADFALITQPICAINVSATAGGTTSGRGEYAQGSPVTLMAFPESGYLFVEWTENGEQISTDESFTFTADHDRTFVANFAPIPKPIYTVQVSSTQGGTVEGSGNYEEGEFITVNAAPDNGYRFLRWEEGGEQVCTEARYSFTAAENRILVAIFERIPQSAPDLTYKPAHNPGIPSTSYRPNIVQPIITSLPSQEEIKKITLTNGKAVLIAPDNLFWEGYKTGRDNGTETVTRADLAHLIYYMMDSESVKIYEIPQSLFSDVKAGTWYESAVGTMRNTGIMFGCGNNLFCPDRALTWGELLTVFTRFTEDKPLTVYYTGEHWAKDSINKAFTLGWLEYTEGFDPGKTVTTNEMVDLIQAVFQWNNK